MIGPPRAKEKILNMKMVNEGIRVMSYAVRGPLLLRANELEKELKAVMTETVSIPWLTRISVQGVEKPFSQ